MPPVGERVDNLEQILAEFIRNVGGQGKLQNRNEGIQGGDATRQGKLQK